MAHSRTLHRTTALSRCLAENGAPLHSRAIWPRSKRDEAWLPRHNIDLHEVIVTMIALARNMEA